ncbi:hypothetical protein B0920_02640 [Massilia sp. KIM]|uniref:hypothetical protein n=1 Tax=Massilia sp. KIM TaxID=1955422 RepID=UPI00098F7E86|nr:hypothetical protein [Massilia sp. KIM]OON62384.1 hypothetical protein B0920_02640 [Massilia sp. KIM]
MNTHIRRSAKRLALALLLAGGLGGCAVYGPPYAYDSGYSYYDGPGYAYPPVSVDLGFSYYDRGPRHYGGHGWGHGRGRGHHGGHHGGHRGRGRH